MPKFWPYDKIRELLALADAIGEASALLESSREAELFRFAIYGFRKSNPTVGQNISITLDDNKVILTKRTKPIVAILQEQET